MNQTNYKIIEKLVSREVIACASSLIYRLQQSEEFQEEMLELSLKDPDYEEAAIQQGWKKTEDGYFKDGETSFTDSWEELCDEKRIEPSYPEVFEHWIVTSWFGELLKEHGECVGDFEGLTIWGRCTTGQAIAMDGIMYELASKLEILEGERNSWA